MARWFSEGILYWGTRFGMRFAVWFVKAFPHSIVFALAKWLAGIGFYLFRGFRCRSMKNMTLALGDKLSEAEIRRTAQRSLTNFFYSFAEIPMTLASRPDVLENEISFKGREHLEAALARGNGVIVLSAHLGNFFLLGTRLTLAGYKTHVLVNQPKQGRFAQLMDDYRLQVLQTTIHARPRDEAFRQLIQVLRQNDLAVVIADEYRKGNQGVRVPFFGRTVLARRGPVTLALRTGAAVVPAFLIRDAENRLTLVIEPELQLIRTRRDKAAIAENTLRITQWLERTVRLYPDQWNWITINWHDVVDAETMEKRPHSEQLSH